MIYDDIYIIKIYSAYVFVYVMCFVSDRFYFLPMAPSHLLLRGRSELFGLLRGDGGGHVEGQHQFVVAELLVELQLGDEVVGEGHDGLDAVLQLAVAEVVEQFAHLGSRQGEETTTGKTALHHRSTPRRSCQEPAC